MGSTDISKHILWNLVIIMLNSYSMIFISALMLSCISGGLSTNDSWGWYRTEHEYDKNCPNGLWKQYFAMGKYEAMWWGHNGLMHPDFIQFENTGRNIDFNF